MFQFIAVYFHRIGLSANTVTLMGFLFSAAAGLLIVCGRFVPAAFLILIAGGCDLVDGRIARLEKSKSRFGALLDSSLDRYGDAFYWGGAALYYALDGRMFYGGLAFSAWLGSFIISYVRARSEGLSQECRVGFWERAERNVLLAAALLAGNLGLAVLYVGVLTHGTALKRLLYARRRMQGREARPVPIWLQRENRASWTYRLQAAFFLLTTLFLPIEKLI